MTAPGVPLGAAAIADAVMKGARGPVDAVEAAFDQADRVNAGPGGLNALLWSDERAVRHEPADLTR